VAADFFRLREARACCAGDCALDGLSRSTEGNKEDKDSLSAEPKRFEKCCSHRFAAGRIRRMCGPVAGLLPAVLFHIRETVHRTVATAAAVLFNSIQTESSLSSFPSV